MRQLVDDLLDRSILTLGSPLMKIAMHKNARTTPASRAEIASCPDSVVALAQRYGISEEAARKWKKRTNVHDASHTPHRLQTTLTPGQ